jgi:atypical dual specificity phosphatase
MEQSIFLILGFFFFHFNLQVRLEHILERISLISEAANTEKPSSITNSLFIGGALAARSVHTLQHLGITHILCLCGNEIGQSESQHPDLFQYKNFSVSFSSPFALVPYFWEQCSVLFYTND